MRRPTLWPSMRAGALVLAAALALVGCGGTSDNGDGGADGGVDDGGVLPGMYHPEGYWAPEAHGLEFNMQTQDCRSCHGQDLTGTTRGPGCDLCHTTGSPGAWRTQCTFCHGGGENMTGAPPYYLDQSPDGPNAKFTKHSAHVSSLLTPSIDCVQCHVKATDVLSPNHAFDATPGMAETDFGAGRAKMSTWDRNAQTCANNYCHGSGRADDGTVAVSAGKQTCTSCHPGVGSAAADLGKMSGLHSSHLLTAIGGSIGCADCHNATTRDNASIVLQGANLHIDGMREVAFAGAGVTFDSSTKTCTGSCHTWAHSAAVWQGAGAKYHPPGWVATKGQPQPHGAELETGKQDCRGCHGADLNTLTGTQTQTCDQCHSANGDAGWRTNCTFCHGTAGGTGAPPRDLGSAPGSTSASFVSHGAHLAGRISPTWTCTQCHVMPGGTDPVLAMNHVFPSDGVAEVTLAGSTRPTGSPAGTYSKGTCSNLYCHGNGQANTGTYTDGNATPTCASCHPAVTSPASTLVTMSGLHSAHITSTLVYNGMAANITCADCHQGTTTDNVSIANKAIHIDTVKQVSFSTRGAGLTYDAANKQCTGTCHGYTHSAAGWAGGTLYHPAGYSAANVHGLEFNLAKQNCMTCHGSDLKGTTTATSCDNCHTPASPTAWRTQCTFCHGGTDNTTGAPPTYLDETTTGATAKFVKHSKHVMTTLTTSIDCVQCHVKATDVLSPGHVLDSTPAIAETDFGAGKSKQTVWNRTALTCTNNYCHGSGRADDGTVTVTDGTRTCTSCHAGPGSASFTTMSGAHAAHLTTTIGGSVTCLDCHNATTRDNSTIVQTPNVHINGLREIVIPSTNGVTYTAASSSCTGTCHGYSHNNLIWTATGGNYHPAGWVAAKGQPQPHGYDLELGRQDCRGCHGADLNTLAGTQPQTCDQCHTANGDSGWRDKCTFCHGGGDNQTGAPPRDLASAPGTTSQSFRSHTGHLAGNMSAVWTCTQCHVMPTTPNSVLAPNHVFPGDGIAEVTLAGSVRPTGTTAGTYSAGTCSNLWCHGNGRGNNGTYVDGNAAPTCTTCHGGMASSATWSTMSSFHSKHLGFGNVTCYDCHATVSSTDGKSLVNKALHIDAVKQVSIPQATLTWSATNRNCTGSCHGQSHTNDPWGR